MSKARTHREPKQQRSRDTLQRLLAATVMVLEEQGLDATVPRIAKAAKVAPASIYRRFVDKDALLRAAFLEVLRQSNAMNQDTLAKAMQCQTLEETVARVISALFEQYRRHPRLLKALTRFMESDTDEVFGRNARLHIAENFNLIVDALLPFRAGIHHPLPRQALQFALLWAGSAMEAYALDSASLWHTVLPLSEKEFKAELTRGFVAYLRHSG
ncbi:TetR/AcrR family transcriptional regulator [Dyella monticola]|uniref:TetR/AcrR family transcriptional regulator n=1 Tax=Dyella monticola TaxID=1927958 RepID=A0A370WTV3_9GAMM|nr:TetR/AcrR family transcriptional regulator [Dyella monticola]RDS79564.1 TetR/AcrR family transcriptional regulator [Dyella monticola]